MDKGRDGLDGMRFACDLMYLLGAGGPRNIVIAPESLRIALGMAAAAAPAEVEAAAPDFLMAPAVCAEALKSVNSIWIRSGEAALLEEFARRLRETWSAIAESVDFDDEPAALERINGAIRRATNGAIKNLLKETGGASLVLVNALSFGAALREPFHKEATQKGRFTLSDGNGSLRTMMSHLPDAKKLKALEARRMRGLIAPGEPEEPLMPHFEGIRSAAATLMRLPFKEKGLSIALVLPGSSMDEALEALPDLAGGAAVARGAAERFSAPVMAPKFRMAFEMEAKSALAAVGFDALMKAPITRAFPGELFISAVRHAADVTLDEKGAVAQAATVLEVERGPMPGTRFRVDFDRPFLFMIEKEGAPVPLFMGYVADPEWPED